MKKSLKRFLPFVIVLALCMSLFTVSAFAVDKRNPDVRPTKDGKAWEAVDEDGNVLGTHKGIIRYTIGQRKGLGLALPAPMYVKEKDLKNNRVVLCDNESLFSKELTAKDINLISVDKITEPMRVCARVRYNQKEQPATVTQLDDDTIKVVFDEPQRAISKGQAVVLYDGDTVIGGGTII